MENKIVLTFILLMAPLYTLTAHAQGGGSVGNGGDAVLELDANHERYYVLKDLYDIKLYDLQNVFTARQLHIFEQPTEDFSSLVDSLRPAMRRLPFSSDLKDGVLYVLSRLDPTEARFLAAPLALYHWEFSEKEKFVDDYRDPEDYRTNSWQTKEADWGYRYGVHQAARRIGDTIYISNYIFNYMDKFNQVALILHEMIYSLLNADPRLDYGQKPEDVRTAVAALFKLLLNDETAIYHFGDTVNFKSFVQKGPVTDLQVDQRAGTYRLKLQSGDAVQYRFVPLVTPKFETQYLKPELISKP